MAEGEGRLLDCLYKVVKSDFFHVLAKWEDFRACSIPKCLFLGKKLKCVTVNRKWGKWAIVNPRGFY